VAVDDCPLEVLLAKIWQVEALWFHRKRSRLAITGAIEMIRSAPPALRISTGISLSDRCRYSGRFSHGQWPQLRGYSRFEDAGICDETALAFLDQYREGL
jgi:hypothetical protein